MSLIVFESQHEHVHFVTNILLHSIFFIIRTIIICINNYKKNSIIEKDLKFYRTNWILTNLFSILSLVLIIKSSFNNNIYGFNLSIGIILHNIVFVIYSELLVSKQVDSVDLYLDYILIILYFSEFLYSIIMKYIKRHETNLYLFKNIGADPKINKAFQIRKILETILYINLVVPSACLMRIVLAPSEFSLNFKMYFLSSFIISIIIQLLIYIDINRENVSRRIIALVLIVSKIILDTTVLLIIISIRILKNKIEKSHNSVYILLMDTILQTSLNGYFTYKDYLLFNSGIDRKIRTQINISLLD